MRTELQDKIILLRHLFGFLGEKSQAGWWSTQFLSATSRAFLEPVFVRTWRLARLSGVSEAAMRVHDERIGVGRVFHLFRLPEVIELSLFERFDEAARSMELDALLNSSTTAIEKLKELAPAPVELRDGPIQIGTTDDFERNEWLARAAAAYHAAFAADAQSFPYFVERS